MKKNMFLIIMLVVFGSLTSCKQKDNTRKESFQQMPYLNKSDSLSMIQIYKKIGPWGKDWDLRDIQTWGGVDIALDESTNQYRIVAFNSYGSFSGKIPDDFRKLTELRILGLGGGELSGNIPEWIGELTNLTYLYIGLNRISGTIPKSIGRLKKLETLIIGGNKVSGYLPEEIGQLENLRTLQIMQTDVGGSIPKSLKNLKNIEQIYLDGNHLSGEFPIEILKPGIIVRCQDNDITGLDFSIWRDDIKITPPDLQGNRLSGEIPKWVTRTKKWEICNYLVDAQQTKYGYYNYKED